MDASIAGDVVRTCISRAYHDNFLTKPQMASQLPIIYNEAFIELMDPLYIIKRLLYLNIIRYRKTRHNRMNRKEYIELGCR